MTRHQLTDEQIAAKFPKGTAGRKAIPAAQAAPGGNGNALAEVSQAADQLAAIQASYSDERDLLNQLLGQAQMADAFEQFSRTVRTSKLAYVKENKLYRAMKGMPTANGSQFSGTWDEFCQLLGTSRDKVELDIANLRAFGEEALDSMSKMGIGYREMRQYRKLPEDQKLALIEVAKTGDKESFVELAEEIISRHAKEKEALTAQVEEAAASLEAKDRVLADKNERINKLEEQTSRKFKPLPGSEAQTAEEQVLLDELANATLTTWVGLKRVFKAADAALQGSMRESIETRARQDVEWLAQKLAEICNEYGIQVNFEEQVRPSWFNEDALAAMEAQQAQAANDAATTKGGTR
ncbi:MAG: hypothetical protein JZU58_28570 [Curvibacter lanceolatus]|uniref:hypothetical protein n=1 Tax=Curvibacter lanceolatus TaxID=86182 RepID=UPI0023526EBF|nr:hypothetical protein [Curvibacter lanceolatus]MBV5296313.1 hypothetical protein [Curvibacter lanceolatus]